jgi:hypothetical protein
MDIEEQVARAMRLAETDAQVGDKWEPGERARYDEAWNDAPEGDEDAAYNPDRKRIREKWLLRARAAIAALRDEGWRSADEVSEAAHNAVRDYSERI